MAKVSVRDGFSDRNEIKPENTEIQIKEFDKRTRIKLQNMIGGLYLKIYYNNISLSGSYIQSFLQFVLGEVYSEPIDVRRLYSEDSIFKMINSTIHNDEYDDVLTLIEAIAKYWDSLLRGIRGANYYNEYTESYYNGSIFEEINDVFETEYIGYRFIGGILVPISNTIEVGSIKEALKNKYAPVSKHISKASSYLADREKPDYENSIKESISAVEAICEIITGLKGKEANLNKMLDILEAKGVKVHKSLKAAFDRLYSYTCDANGVRHAGDIAGPASTFEEARFMLVSCSAFINYIIGIWAD